MAYSSIIAYNWITRCRSNVARYKLFIVTAVRYGSCRTWRSSTGHYRVTGIR